MSQDLYGWAYLLTTISTLLGVIFTFIQSLRNGKKIEAQHAVQKDIASSLFQMTGRVYNPPSEDKQK